jgi:hypothetical protein
MIQPNTEFNLGKEPLTFRGAANGIWNKLNLALALTCNATHKAQLEELIKEARAVADAIVHHPDADNAFVRCEVLQAHLREHKGQTVMLDPLLSGIVALPYDDQTKKAIASRCLKIHTV